MRTVESRELQHQVWHVRWPSCLLKRTGLLTRARRTKTEFPNIGNDIRCESHREVLTTLAQSCLDFERQRPALRSEAERTTD